MERSKRLYTHILFWLGAAMFIIFFLGGVEKENWLMMSFYVGLLLPVTSLTSYACNYWLLPKLFFAKKYIQFAVYSFFVFAVSIYLQMMVVVLAFSLLANYNLENMIPGTANVFNLGVGLYFIVMLSAVIYLIKRMKETSDAVNAMQEQEKEQVEPLFVKVNRETVKLDPTTILFIESLDNYVKIHLHNKDYTVRERIGKLAETLDGAFIRIHRSFLINPSHIESFTKEAVTIQGRKLTISRTYKKAVLDILQSKVETIA